MSVFDARYKNDDNGRPAYDPALMLKIVLSAYARGFTSSRQIERLCRENVVFMALSADIQPHFTTIAKFIAQMSDVIQSVFTEVLMVCDDQGLIGKEMFAIDGCKLPSNASKEWSGTMADLTKKQKKIEVLRKASRKIKKFCKTSVDKPGLKSGIVKSNITDNDSAKMLTSHGVVQGYNGVSAVDNKHQIVVAAEAFGQGPENNLLEPIVEQLKDSESELLKCETKITADSGFHSKETLSYCIDENIDAYISDGNFRNRDPRFIHRDRYQQKSRQAQWFKADDFSYRVQSNECICPAGNKMWCAGTRIIDHNEYINFVGYLKDCRTCPLQNQCMRKPPREQGRQVSIKIGVSTAGLSVVDKMKEKIDSDSGRHIYSQRLGTVEPVFGNINTTKRLNRFSLCGKTKVNTQWQMFCLVHNIEKLQRYGQIA